MKQILIKLARKPRQIWTKIFGVTNQELSLASRPAKAESDDFNGRFRDIVSDPINLLIERHPLAGQVVDGHVVLHNGIQVPATGPYAYYGSFSDILIFNRGVHEPLEEYVFQQVLSRLPSGPVMLELGAYWGHYSMWCQKLRPEARNILVEPLAENLEAARRNFVHNHLTGEMIESFVGVGKFAVDDFVAKAALQKIDILHSDIQGFELEMLKGAEKTIEARQVDFVFVSTHSRSLHASCGQFLKKRGYRIEVDSDFGTETTSSDGLIFATSPSVAAVFKDFSPLGRLQIAESNSQQLYDYLGTVLKR